MKKKDAKEKILNLINTVLISVENRDTKKIIQIRKEIYIIAYDFTHNEIDSNRFKKLVGNSVHSADDLILSISNNRSIYPQKVILDFLEFNNYIQSVFRLDES